MQACRNLAQKVHDKLLRPEDIDESLFADELETSHANELPDYPDLLIRTSGELRLSNFLLWVSVRGALLHGHAVARLRRGRIPRSAGLLPEQRQAVRRKEIVAQRQSQAASAMWKACLNCQ